MSTAKNKDKSRQNLASLNNVFKSKDHNIFIPYSYTDVIVCFYKETEHLRKFFTVTFLQKYMCIVSSQTDFSIFCNTQYIASPLSSGEGEVWFTIH